MKTQRTLATWAAVLIAASVNLKAQVFTTLHGFSATTGTANVDGAESRSDLLLAGNWLIGTAPFGGASGYGTIFTGYKDGSAFQVIHDFSGGDDGAVPNKDLVLSGLTLYGLVGRGTNLAGYGSIFSVDTIGGNFSILYNFDTSANGGLGQPNAGLLLAGDTLYGVAYQGGISNAGSIFSVTTNGAFNLLHLFNAGTDGENPLGNLVQSGGTLYGTTRNGGSNGLAGTVFSINTDGSGFTVLHTFSGNPSLDGQHPEGLLALSGGTIYGTTVFGGTNGGGTVFSIGTDGSHYSVLHSFNTAAGDGKLPEAGVTLCGNTLYGTTLGNGSNLGGTIFSVNTVGSGFTTLYEFSPVDGSSGTNADGSQPYGGVTISGNVLYGTTSVGGPSGSGTVFSLAVEPKITGLSVAGTNLVLQVSRGVAGSSCVVLTATGLNLPLAQWTPVATNIIGAGNTFTLTATNAVSPGAARQFYVLQVQ